MPLVSTILNHFLTISILEDDVYILQQGRGVRVLIDQEEGPHLGVIETTLLNPGEREGEREGGREGGRREGGREGRSEGRRREMVGR